MICGIIDIGSNSVLLVVGDQGKIILDLDSVTRLGEGLNSSKELKPEAIKRTVTTVCKFKRIAEKYGAQKVLAVGTMALRMAENSKEFENSLLKECDLRVRILTGDEEARLSFRGAVESLDLAGKIATSDIGGRSTEIAIGEDGNAEFVKSLDIGALTLMEKFNIGTDPIPPDTLLEMIDFAGDKISEVLGKVQADHLVGIGGTITNLAAIKLKLESYDPDKVHGLKLSYGEISEIIYSLASLPLEDRKNTSGLQPERADTIIPGTAIVLGIMKTLEFNEITVSDRALRHALLADCTRGML